MDTKVPVKQKYVDPTVTWGIGEPVGIEHEIISTRVKNRKKRNTKETLYNRISLLEEDIECLHMSLDKMNIPRIDQKNGWDYSINGRVKLLMMEEERLYNRIIPYGKENLITTPLWEEGDLRPSINIWQIPQGETPSDCLESYNNIRKLCQEYFNIFEKEYTFGIFDDYSFTDRLLPINMKNSFTIQIFQKGYILDMNGKANYLTTKLYLIAGNLLQYIKEKL